MGLNLGAGLTWEHWLELQLHRDGQVRKPCPESLKTAVEPVNWKRRTSVEGGMGEGRRCSEKGAIRIVEASSGMTHSLATRSVHQWKLQWFGLVWFLAGCAVGPNLCGGAGQLYSL